MSASADDRGRPDTADADGAAMLGRFAVRRGGRGDREALAHGLVVESAEGLRLASELVADQQVRASLRRHVEELTALSEASSAAGCEPRARS